MIITEQKLRKIIKKLISENSEEQYYNDMKKRTEDDAFNQGEPNPEMYSLNHRGEIKDIKHPGYEVVIIDNVVHYEDKHTGEILNKDEFNNTIGNVDFDYPQTYDENEIQSTQPDLYDMPKGGYDEDGNILDLD